MLIEEILKRIQDDYQGGMTQADLSKKYNITQQHVNRLLCGKRSIEKMGVGTFLKMFPKATIYLDECVKIVPKSENKDTMRDTFFELYDNLNVSDRIKALAFMNEMALSKNKAHETSQVQLKRA